MGRVSCCCLRLLLALTLSVCALELTASKLCGSLTLLTLCFHTLSTLLALSGHLLSLSLCHPSCSPAHWPYGWRRAGLLGALLDATFLTSLSLASTVKVAERVLHPLPLRRPRLLVAAGLAGFLYKLGSAYLLRGQHRHSGGGVHYPLEQHCKHLNEELLREAKPQDARVEWDEDVEDKGVSCKESEATLQGVYQHLMGGSLGSGLVLVEAVTFYALWPACPVGLSCLGPPPCPAEQCEDLSSQGESLGLGCWLLYLDPALSLAVAGLALRVALPRLKASGLVLLQAVPRHLDPGRLQTRLLGLEGVEGLHELHVWQLTGLRVVASAHVKCRQAEHYPELAARIASILCQEGILSSTVQPEFGEQGSALCELACGAKCTSKLCCSGVPGNGLGNPSPASKCRPKPSLQQDDQFTTEYETNV